MTTRAAPPAIARPYVEGTARYSSGPSLRRWRFGWRAWRRHFRSRPRNSISVAGAMTRVFNIFEEAGGPIGLILRKGLGPRVALELGRAVDRPIPLPMLRVADLPRRFRRASELRNGAIAWTNLIVACVKLLYCWHAETAVCARAPPAAQTRMLLNIHGIVVSFLRAAGPWPSEAEIQACLRQKDGHQPSGGAAVPIGDRGGVPSSAADVSLVDVLEDTHPAAAEQARSPTALLLPPAERPQRLKKPYSRLHRTYPDLVRHNCKAGLQRLVGPNKVWKHKGKRVASGMLGVAKSDTEDRTINDLSLNCLVDPDKLIRPQFGYPPLSRTLRATAGRTLVVRKRDLRHLFYHLRLGRRWHKHCCADGFRGQRRLGAGCHGCRDFQAAQG